MNSEQERLSLALSSAEIGTWDWDVPAGVIWWDERMHALFGLAPATFKGDYEGFLALIHHEDRERVRDEFTRTIEARSPLDTQFQVAKPVLDGGRVIRMRSSVHCDDKSQIRRIAGVAWDITERRKAELSLAKERNLLSTLMENLPHRIYFKDLDSRFIVVSRACSEWHGFKDPGDMIGKSDGDLFSTEHADAALADEREIIRTGNPIVDYEEKETRPDSEDTWASTTKMPLRDAEGQHHRNIWHFPRHHGEKARRRKTRSARGRAPREESIPRTGPRDGARTSERLAATTLSEFPAQCHGGG